LSSSPWQHTDQTSTRVDGQNQHCNIVCNSLYTIYTTTPSSPVTIEWAGGNAEA
jgi:hypothetical protein